MTDDEQKTTEEPETADTTAEVPEQAEATEQAEAGQAVAVETEPAEQLSPKERRRKQRSTHSGEARPQRSPQERHSERVASRKAKAVRRRARRLQERDKRAAARAARGGEVVSPTPTAPLHPPAGEPVRKVRQGIVVSDKADKTITVRIDIARRHRRYEKIVRSSSTLHAHDENNDAHIGDTVRVIESRPLSRTKRWRLIDVLERAR